MSFGERSSSYRRLFGDSPRFSGSSTGPRTMSGTRASASAAGLYRRTGRSVMLDSLDLSQSTAVNNELKIVRTNEKEQLQGLNDRFAMFIDKVRHLEQQNRGLEQELVMLRQKQAESRVHQVYKDEIQELRAQIEALNREKNRLLVERSNQEEDLQRLCVKLEEESGLRVQAELSLKALTKDVDEATAVRLDLERKLDALSDEIGFMKKLHQEEVQELSSLMEAQQTSVEVELSKPDLTSALKDIRSQYESMAVKNLQSAEDWYKSRLAGLSEQASRSGEAVRTCREELGEFRRQLQSKTIENESLRGANESLERQIGELEDGHAAEVAALQTTIAHLDAELRNLKGETARHLREYQDLLNVKMALDIEIAAYRKLLEGEETHFNSGVSFGSHVGPQPRAPGGEPGAAGALPHHREPRWGKESAAKEVCTEEKEEEILTQFND
ncbi:alpha-internexin-like [Eucyclogobius newberryi]|uniref:alpha-internexin-like n=1 Tax=Eucyclogobius newberryi TaxID=166745 RepID=UPI003B5A26EC